LVLRAAPNSLLYSRFAFAVGRRVAHKAVIRNQIRRRIREVVRQSPLKSGWDLLFVARRPAAAASFTALRDAVLNVQRRAGVLELPSIPIERSRGIDAPSSHRPY
jgi:ribonuclease P protein component